MSTQPAATQQYDLTPDEAAALAAYRQNKADKAQRESVLHALATAHAFYAWVLKSKKSAGYRHFCKFLRDQKIEHAKTYSQRVALYEHVWTLLRLAGKRVA